MSISNEARGKITEALNVLTDRFNKTNDDNEKDKIIEAIKELSDARAVLNQAQLLDAADAVVEATVSLERIVKSARLGPFDDYIRGLERVINRVSEMMRNGELTEHLHRASVDPTPATQPQSPGSAGASPAPSQPTPPATGGSPSPPTPPSPPPPSEPPRPSPPPAAPPPPEPPKPPPPASPPSTSTPVTVANSTDFNVLRPEYQQAFDNMAVRAEFKDKVDWHIKQLRKFESRYRAVSPQINNVPWAFIGVIHAMECGFNFACHLHNGDPLTSKTTHVPAGCPKTGTPPFDWETSAVDALKLEGFATVTDWTIPRMLYSLEKYNGFGYRPKKLATPYLWSFSNHYEKGKYVGDGKFDADAVSQQCGAAVMLKELINTGVSLA